MTLIKCPECIYQISSFAVSCPHCGYPITEYWSGIFGSEKVPVAIVVEMQLEQFRSCVAKAGAIQKLMEQQYIQGQNEVNKWQHRVELALQKGDKKLARLALERKNSSIKIVDTLKFQLDEETNHTTNLKHRLNVLESQIALTFELEKSLTQKARTQDNLATNNNDSGNQETILDIDIDTKLEALKTQLTDFSKPQNRLADIHANSSKDDMTDNTELQALRTKLDQI